LELRDRKWQRVKESSIMGYLKVGKPGRKKPV
jgi:hypothetical protein